MEPAGTKRFLTEQRAVEADKLVQEPGSRDVDLGPAITEMLRPYERSNGGAFRAPTPTAHVAEEKAFVVALHEVLQALGLSKE